MLFVRELERNARRRLQADHLKPSLAGTEDRTRPRCIHQGEDLKSLVTMFRERVPEYRMPSRCMYSVSTILGIMGH